MSELSILERLIEENPNIFHTAYEHWHTLTCNPTISLNYIHNHPKDTFNGKYLWDYNSIFMREDLTPVYFEIFLKLAIEEISILSNLRPFQSIHLIHENTINKNIIINSEFIAKYPNLFIKGSDNYTNLFQYVFNEDEIEEQIAKYGDNDLDIHWYKITRNAKLTWNFYKKYLAKYENNYIRRNRNIFYRFIYINYNYWIDLTIHPNTTMEFIESTMDIPEYKWDYNYIIQNPNFTWDFYKRHKNKIKIASNIFSENSIITNKTLDNIPKSKWIWFGLMSNENIVTKEFMLDKENIKKISHEKWLKFYSDSPIADEIFNKLTNMNFKSKYYPSKQKIIYEILRNKYTTSTTISNIFIKNIFNYFSNRNITSMILTLQKPNFKLSIIDYIINNSNLSRNDDYECQQITQNPNLTYDFIQKYKHLITFEYICYNKFHLDADLIEFREREKVIKCALFVILRRVAIQEALIAYEEARKREEPPIRRSKRLRAQI